MIIDWKKTCAKCIDGEVEPRHCEYYGEPNGCNSPTYGEHPPVGNAAAMREALCEIVLLNLKVGRTIRADVACGIIASKAKHALSAPPRNCDVGTADEQSVRFDAFVRDRRGDLNCTGKCPAHNGVDFGVVDCVLQWAQMPYEAQEGGAK